jgi:hypothetical protein
MAEPQTPDRSGAGPADEKLYTLSDISHHTGISMPTLQRYKKTYQDRIPSQGTGRKQRYPEHALPVFEELRSENAGKRGRPRKDAAAAAAAAGGTAAGRPRAKRGAPRRAAGRPGRRGVAAGAGKAAAASPARRGRPRKAAGVAARRGRPPATRAGARRAAGTRGPGRPRTTGRGRVAAGAAGRRGGRPEGLLTLTQISATTGISYPTLVRYVRLHSDRLPHAGKGRARRFYPEAVEVFRSLRQQSGRGGRRAGGGRAAAGTARRGRPPKAGAGAVGRLEAVLARRVRDLERFQQAVEKRFSDLVKGLQKLR